MLYDIIQGVIFTSIETNLSGVIAGVIHEQRHSHCSGNRTDRLYDRVAGYNVHVEHIVQGAQLLLQLC